MSYKEPYTEKLRANFLKYMNFAFKMLPSMDKPLILDPGCGTGIPTIELTKLSNGTIVAIDIDKELIEILNKKLCPDDPKFFLPRFAWTFFWDMSATY